MKQLPRQEDFRDIQIQATIFTPDLKFQSGRVLGTLLGGWPDIFTNVVYALDFPTGVPPEAPRVLIQSEDMRRRVQVGLSRLDLLWQSQDAGDHITMEEFLDWCCEVFVQYLGAMRGRAGRLACTLVRVAEGPEPATELARHFCREDKLRDGGPISSPTDFQIHIAKQYVLSGDFNVNSWVRCKSALTIQTGSQPQIPSEGLGFSVLEHDINTRDEGANMGQYSTERIKEFFGIIPGEIRQIVSLYFPPEVAQ